MKKTLWVVQIDLLDHAQCEGHDTGLIGCSVFGVLFEETKDAYHVSSWVSGEMLDGPDSDTYAIAKRAVLRVKKLIKWG